jgi:hypothetical protein
MVTYYAMHAGGNWQTAGTWSSVAAKDASRVSNGLVPTSSIDCVIDDYSGNITVGSTCYAKSADFNSGGVYAGTFTLNSNLNIYGSITLNSTMNYVHTTGIIALLSTANITLGGKSINNLRLYSGYTFTLMESISINILTLTSSSGIYTLAGNFDITCNTLVLVPTLKIVSGRTITVNTSISAINVGTADIGSPTIQSVTPTQHAHLIYNGLVTKQYLANVIFTDIDASGGNTLYSYQSGALTRTTNIETFSPPPSGGGFLLI